MQVGQGGGASWNSRRLMRCVQPAITAFHVARVQKAAAFFHTNISTVNFCILCALCSTDYGAHAGDAVKASINISLRSAALYHT
jgi:ABC-type antimicrobial peptide transport system permease subunit